MNPFDEDSDSDGLSFNELPPSVRARMAQPQQARPQMHQQVPAYAPQPQMGLVPAGTVEQVQQGRQIFQVQPTTSGPVTQAQPEAKDNSTLLFLGATVLLAGVGYWAYSKMESDRKIRIGPPQLGRGKYRDDVDDVGDDDGAGRYADEESGGPLDAYEDVGLDPKEVDPHEKGGIKLVKG